MTSSPSKCSASWLTTSNFGNARAVRNVLEDALRKQAGRLGALGDLATDEELATIEVQDIAPHRGEAPSADVGPVGYL